MAGLRETLAGMVDAAKRDHGVVRVRLVKGLTVAVKFGADDKPDNLGIQLSRVNVSPSLAEWKTVINAMPQHTVIQDPKPITNGDVHYLKGKIKLSQGLL